MTSYWGSCYHHDLPLFMLDLDCPAELPDSLSTGKFLFPFYFPRLSLEGKSPRAAHHSELCFTSLKEDIEYLYKLLGIFLHRRFVKSPIHLSFIHSIKHSHHYGFMNIHFIHWIIIQYYFICCLNCPIFDQWELLVGSYILLINLISVSACFEHFLNSCHYELLQTPHIYFLPQS